MVDTHFEGVRLGANLPDNWPRERYLRVLKAEANWRSGIMTAQDIARVAEVSPATVYEWAKTYHWPRRDDIAKLSQATVRHATVIAIAMRAKEAARRIRDAKEAAALAAEGSNEGPTQVPGVENLESARDARPLSDVDAERAVVVEQATAAAAQDAITNLFAEQVSEILADQQELANFLVKHTHELAKAMQTVWATYLEVNGKKKNAHDLVRAEVAKQVQVMRALVAMSVQAVQLQRRVWMLDSPGGAGGGIDGDELDLGMPAPTQRDSYEDYVRRAEASGEKLTR